MIKVKNHLRKNKNGKVVSVKLHNRNIDKKNKIKKPVFKNYNNQTKIYNDKDIELVKKTLKTINENEIFNQTRDFDFKCSLISLLVKNYLNDKLNLQIEKNFPHTIYRTEANDYKINITGQPEGLLVQNNEYNNNILIRFFQD